jgi:high-affinity nickel-transport protein
MHAATLPSHVSHALDLALLSIGVLGFRHGFDYDHLAAITDITASQQGGLGRSMAMGFAYILGHAATVAVLASLAILSRLSLPAGFDRWTERLVGLTLVVLGCYVLGSFLRLMRGGHVHGPDDAHHHPMPTRITLLINGVLWLVWRIRQSLSRTPVPRRRVFADGYGGKSSFVVGVIHGLGAETPSQILLFLLAANLGGMAKGFLGLGVFLAGLIIMNTLMCATAAGVFGAGRQRPRLMRMATLLTAAYSLAVGILFLAGGASLLPVLG